MFKLTHFQCLFIQTAHFKDGSFTLTYLDEVLRSKAYITYLQQKSAKVKRNRMPKMLQLMITGGLYSINEITVLYGDNVNIGNNKT